ncbi:CENP-Q, a CENPA-CAD centromere complex subunit-domain-containing protein [Xylariaceae sp. FL0804]|nr:CENP-Q, a CENPA-CAD centromere complex subunit-domain-containing protein [Xylariaceae sp. FL0804]
MSHNAPSKKRGRPAKDVSESLVESSQTDAPRRKRNRHSPPHNGTDSQPPGEKPTSSSALGQPKRLPRGPKKTQASKQADATAEEADDENEGDSSFLRRSGRDRKSTGEWYKAPDVSPKQNDELEQAARIKKTGRPKKTEQPPAGSRTDGGRSPPAGSDSDSSPPPYRRLAKRTRRVPRHTIDAKWTPLDAPSVATVSSVLHAATRPVLHRVAGNLSRHTHATGVLAAVSRRLRAKLARGLPFPPPTTTTSARRGDELAFEHAVGGVQALQAQLAPLLHGVELLRRERAREEAGLRRDYRVLERLGQAARSEARAKREQRRKMHVLVPEKKKKPSESAAAAAASSSSMAADDGGMARGGLELQPVDKGAGRLFLGLGDEDGDEELRDLAKQVGNHMESMRGNLHQIEGVVPAIAKSSALLKAVLQSHLGQEQVDDVLFGHM